MLTGGPTANRRIFNFRKRKYYETISMSKDCAINFKAVLVIDHKPEILKRCDYLVEFGPGAGPEGGKLMFSGVPSDKS